MDDDSDLELECIYVCKILGSIEKQSRGTALDLPKPAPMKCLCGNMRRLLKVRKSWGIQADKSTLLCFIECEFELVYVLSLSGLSML